MIEYVLPEDGNATLRVYNILGREIATLVDGWQQAGVYSTVFEPTLDLPSGIYLYVLTTDCGQAWGRMVLSR